MFVVVCFLPRLSGWHLFVSGSGLPAGPNGLRAGLVQPHPLGPFNLRHLRIMHDDLYHTVMQRLNLPTDYFQPRFVAIVIFLRLTHFKLCFVNSDCLSRL
jgi:hypothetical protein